MSTYTHTDEVGDTLEVYTGDALADTTLITAREIDSGDMATVIVPKSDTPRVALEILKAAGHKEKESGVANDSTVEEATGWAIRWLQIAAGRAEAEAEAEAEAARKAEAEAADKARLDQEAQALYAAANPTCSWGEAFTNTKAAFRSVALAARELHTKDTK